MIAGRLLTLLVGSVAALVVPVGTAGAMSRVSCDERHGSTLLEDAQVRLFKFHAQVYACGRPDGRLHLASSGKAPPSTLDHYQLSGRFVEAYLVGAFDTKIFVLDPRRGTSRKAAEYRSLNGSISEDVLNADGTLVWIDEDGDLGESWVYENTARGTTMLDSDRNNNLSVLIGSLALSTDGHAVYWTNNGVLKSAQIP